MTDASLLAVALFLKLRLKYCQFGWIKLLLLRLRMEENDRFYFQNIFNRYKSSVFLVAGNQFREGFLLDAAMRGPFEGISPSQTANHES